MMKHIRSRKIIFLGFGFSLFITLLLFQNCGDISVQALKLNIETPDGQPPEGDCVLLGNKEFATIPQNYSCFNTVPTQGGEDVAVDSLGNIYLATNAGLAISRDGGETFKTLTTSQAPFLKNGINSVVVDSQDNVFLYSKEIVVEGDSYGLAIYKSSDRGQSFHISRTDTNGGPLMSIDGDTVYYATIKYESNRYVTRLVTSSDHGSSWQERVIPMPTQETASHSQPNYVVPSLNNFYFRGSNFYMMFDWERIYKVNLSTGTSVRVSPSTGGVGFPFYIDHQENIYLSEMGSQAQGFVFSSNGGASYTSHMGTGYIRTYGKFDSESTLVAISSGQIVKATPSGGVLQISEVGSYPSSDLKKIYKFQESVYIAGERGFQKVGQSVNPSLGVGNGRISSIIEFQGRLVVSDEYSGTFFSEDGGQSFSRASYSSMKHFRIYNDKLFGVSNSGLFKSNDGVSFVRDDSSFGYFSYDLLDYAENPQGDQFAASFSRGLLMRRAGSIDIQVIKISEDQNEGRIDSLVLNPNSLTEGLLSSPKGLYKLRLGSSGVYELVPFSPSISGAFNRNSVWNITYQPGNIVTLTDGQNFAISTNGGSSFVSHSNPSGVKGRHYYFANTNTLYIATYPVKGLFVSENQGGNFIQKKVENGLPSDRIETVFEDSQGNVYIGTDSGLAIKKD